MTIVRLSDLKKGDYFRFPNKKLVYTYDGKTKGRYNTKFCYTPHNDVWGSGYQTKTNRFVEVDFDY